MVIWVYCGYKSTNTSYSFPFLILFLFPLSYLSVGPVPDSRCSVRYKLDAFPSTSPVYHDHNGGNNGGNSGNSGWNGGSASHGDDGDGGNDGTWCCGTIRGGVHGTGDDGRNGRDGRYGRDGRNRRGSGEGGGAGTVPIPHAVFDRDAPPPRRPHHGYHHTRAVFRNGVMGRTRPPPHARKHAR